MNDQRSGFDSRRFENVSLQASVQADSSSPQNSLLMPCCTCFSLFSPGDPPERNTLSSAAHVGAPDVIWATNHRRCSPIIDEFKPSYSSVLLIGPEGLRSAVTSLEEKPIIPCFTAWCERCCKGFLITRDLPEFRTPTEHHVHKLVLLASLKQHGFLLD